MAHDAEATMYKPMQIAVSLMAKAFNVPSAHHILHDEELQRKATSYTQGHADHHVPESTAGTMARPRKKISLQELPFFMKE